MSALSEYAGTRELLVNLTLRELRSKYKKSVLGWTWSLLNPLASVADLHDRLLGVPPGRPTDRRPERAQRASWCSSSARWCPGTSCRARIERCRSTRSSMNGNLIKKVYFPRELLVASTIASLVVTFAASSSACSA